MAEPAIKTSGVFIDDKRAAALNKHLGKAEASKLSFMPGDLVTLVESANDTGPAEVRIARYDKDCFTQIYFDPDSRPANDGRCNIHELSTCHNKENQHDKNVGAIRCQSTQNIFGTVDTWIENLNGYDPGERVVGVASNGEKPTIEAGRVVGKRILTSGILCSDDKLAVRVEHLSGSKVMCLGVIALEAEYNGWQIYKTNSENFGSR